MSRHFQNSFPEYSAEVSKDILDVSAGGAKITSEYRKTLLKVIDELQAVIEQNTKQWRSNSDVSVYTGVAGQAVMLLQRYYTLDDNSALQKAEELVAICLQSVGRSSKTRVTYLCGDAGPLTCAALTAQAAGGTGPLGTPDQYIDRLLSLSESVVKGSHGLPDELLYGRVGYIYSLLLLHRSKVSSSSRIAAVLPSICEAVLKSGEKLAGAAWPPASCPLMYEWHGKRYYGAAHGIAGILIVLMQARDYLPPGALETLIRPSVDYMQRQLFPSGNLPSSEGSGSGDKLVHWCHGAPAAVLLFAMAYKVFESTQYLQAARKCCAVVWQRGLLKKGYGLCHGSAGNAYCFLYMYQVTGEAEYLYQACQFGSWCQQYGEHGCSVPDRPYSLFEGLAGNMHFLLDLTRVDQAVFPGLILPLA
uniref:LanC-like protein 1 n=1 Tax=Hirondellea gigas TaxID=1518452 RepID=A0A2P2HZJ1_9CRUS